MKVMRPKFLMREILKLLQRSFDLKDTILDQPLEPSIFTLMTVRPRRFNKEVEPPW